MSTDKNLINHQVVYDFLVNSSWAKGIGRNEISQSIKNSLCFGLYKDDKMIGFARVIRDYVRFAYLCDVFVIEDFRGRLR
ncbi:MAG: GNAT family N-acetyltransferase [Neisseriaceae bacterium]|nr:GNAT family N-acetyltransferase [Neisseriaceae bacterium]